jgi:hypothetical protein
MAPPRPSEGGAKKRLARAAVALAAAAALAVAGVLVFYEPVREPELVVRDSSGALRGRLRVPDGRFSHVFLHSFHLTPVEERFRIEATGRWSARFRLYELSYQSSGVGMPADAEGGYRLENGFFVLTMDRTFDSIPVLVSIVPGHGIMTGDAYWPFRNWADPEAGLELTARMVLSFRLRR